MLCKLLFLLLQDVGWLFINRRKPYATKESPSDYLSHDKYGQVILESQVLDVPKIIDVCVIYGDANRSTVTKIVHSAFRHQPLFKERVTRSRAKRITRGSVLVRAQLSRAKAGSSSLPLHGERPTKNLNEGPLEERKHKSVAQQKSFHGPAGSHIHRRGKRLDMCNEM